MSVAVEVLDVAKKRAKAEEPIPEPSRVGKSSMLTIRGSEAWREWVNELAAHDRSGTVADLIDRALVDYARKIKFVKPAPQR